MTPRLRAGRRPHRHPLITAPAGWTVRGVSLPWWTAPLAIFTVTRLVAGVMIAVAQRHQIAVTHAIKHYELTRATPPHPGYLGVAANWDGQWYWRIALTGFPHTLPQSASGAVERNEWAFGPLYPMVTRVLMWASGADFPLVATVVSVLMSLAAVTLVFYLLDESAGRFTAVATTLLLCTSMASPTFQIAYTEGPALFFVALALLLLRRRRYAATALALLALALTRHILAPFVVVVAVHALLRWREQRSAAPGTPLDRRPAVLLVASVGLVGLWPAVAAITTGRLTAFTDTQATWRRTPTTGPFGVFTVAEDLGGPVALVSVVAVAVALVWLVLRPGSPRWDPEVRAWAAAYPVYLLMVAPAAVSLIRLLLLAFPLMWVLPETATSRRARLFVVVVLAVAGLCLQWYWIRHFLVIGPLDQQVGMP